MVTLFIKLASTYEGHIIAFFKVLYSRLAMSCELIKNYALAYLCNVLLDPYHFSVDLQSFYALKVETFTLISFCKFEYFTNLLQILYN